MSQAVSQHTTRRTLVKALAAAPMAATPVPAFPDVRSVRIDQLCRTHHANVARRADLLAKTASMSFEEEVRFLPAVEEVSDEIDRGIRELANRDAAGWEDVAGMLDVLAFDAEDGRGELGRPCFDLLLSIIRNARALREAA